MKSVDNMILDKIRSLGKGSVFATRTFFGFGSRTAVNKALSRLAQKGTVRRLSRGLYDYPRTLPMLGLVPPDPNAVVMALHKNFGIRVQLTGAHAANFLGLSEQVPAKITFLTDGRSRVISVGNQQIHLHHASLMNIATAGRMSGLVIQALRYMGRNYVDDRVVSILRRTLKDRDRKRLLADIPYAPAWVAPYLRKIASR